MKLRKLRMRPKRLYWYLGGGDYKADDYVYGKGYKIMVWRYETTNPAWNWKRR